MPRLFAALEIPHHAATTMSMLRGGLSGARWIDMESYHLTLRFIGDIEHHMADEIAHALERVHRRQFMLGFSGLGAFGGKKPHSLFAVPTASPDLFELQAEIARICRRLGLAPDPRKFTPHVTLARLRGTSPAAVANYISIRGGFYVPPFKIDRFVLMSSRDSVGGGPYIAEQTYPLAPERIGTRRHADPRGSAAMSR
ncbi:MULTISPECIES: RNA 2',3'-cyclic phosphodiesterase [unclassified Roseitalea]|uniref:RNA 2',3'-cyclic phosphodiesterase n=1 Tax=unclassified Roseitalea TaxID=2639107 RepID=UPI00273E7197|nr:MULTISPECIES: RNA 2',3'-cyclic phosphodiesterase [unclassified Roseitalea]